MVVRWCCRRFSEAKLSKLSDRPSGHPNVCEWQQCRLETEQDCLWVAISNEAGHCLFGHVFLAQFHEDWLIQHFQWLQAVDDVAKKPGFRSRQILVRHHLRRKRLERLQTRIDSNLFGDCDSNPMNFDDEKKQKQKKKSQAASLDKHCL
jgi:hypothetical protein